MSAKKLKTKTITIVYQGRYCVKNDIICIIDGVDHEITGGIYLRADHIAVNGTVTFKYYNRTLQKFSEFCADEITIDKLNLKNCA